MSCVSETSPEKKSDLQSDSKPNDSSNPIRPPMQEVSKFSITTCSTNENEHAPNALRTPISLRRLRNCVRVIPIILRAGNNKRKRITAPVDFNHSPTVPSLKPFVPNTACVVHRRWIMLALLSTLNPIPVATPGHRSCPVQPTAAS